MHRRTLLLGIAGGAAAPLALRLGVARAQDATPMADASPMAGGPPPPPAGTELFASGLNNPRGLAFGPDGLLYIAEAGVAGTEACTMGPEGYPICYGSTGAITRIDADGAVKQILSGLGNSAMKDTGMNGIGPSAVAFADSTMIVVTGLGADPKVRDTLGPIGKDLGRLFKLVDGQRTDIADISGYEASANPDGAQVDSNPFALAVLPDGAFAVVDAGGNSLLKVTPGGQISTLAVFKQGEAKMDDGSTIPYDAVPDALALSPDGSSLTVGTLTGAPFPVGGASVWSVPIAGGDPTETAKGFTNIIDLAYGPDGSLYVLEMLKNGLGNMNPADPTTMGGQLTRVAPDGTKSVILGDGLVFPTALAIGPDKMLYIANFGTLAGGASIVRTPLPG